MIRIMTDGVIPNTQNKKYIIETASELSQLEAVFGNEAYCIGNETTYICNGSGTYVVKKNVGENELPYVSSDDNGVLLGVEDGNWSKSVNSKDLARVNGNYDDLGAGYAKQLVSTNSIGDSAPYSFRKSGGGADIGSLEYDEIVGGTIAWNQYINNGNFVDSTRWSTNRCTPTASDNIGRFTCNSAEYSSWGFYQSPPGITAHKYMGIGSFRCHTVNSARSLTFQSSGSRLIDVVGTTRQNNPVNDVWYDLAFIGVYNEVSATAFCELGYANKSDITVGTDYIEARNVMLFDITQMFGAEIADYIYSLESTRAGAGIEFFKNLFPNAYYAKEDGALVSVRTSSHDMVGYNQWDEEWESGSINDYGANSANANNLRSKNYIKVIPSESYVFTKKASSTMYFRYYDSDYKFIGKLDYNGRGNYNANSADSERKMPKNCRYLRFYVNESTYDNDICVSFFGPRRGEYEPYQKNSYPLDSLLELRGIPKLDSNNHMYYDGDLYKSDGSVTRRFYEVSSADCSIGGYDASSARWYLVIPNTAPDITPSLTTEVGKIRTSRYFTTIRRVDITASTKYCITHRDYDTAYSSRQFVFTIDPDIVSTVEEARAWVANHPFSIVYECVESAEGATPFTSPQRIDKWGSEEYVDYAVQQELRDVSIPVGHNSSYPKNLLAKLESLPDLASADGLYIIEQTGDNMTLQAVGSVPDTNGTYVLKCVVNNGTKTFSWVVE